MKNLTLKRLIKKTIFPFFTFVNKLIPKNDNYVLLYIPGKRFVYSLGPIKQYLLENRYDKKYKISYGYQDLEHFGEGIWVEILAMIKSILFFFQGTPCILHFRANSNKAI